MANINEINELYKSEEGDRLALEELLVVVERYVNISSPKVLEIGCGYGRNLFALSHISQSQITGCDVSLEELRKAKEKLDSYNVKNVILVQQKENGKLPFEDNSFDFVVIWQVFEHVLSREDKQKLFNEVTRVVRNGGHILIETPNFLFPIDYHDNNLPLAHWFLPDRCRYRITRKVRDEDFPPSQYLTIYQMRRLFRQSPYLKSFEQKTRIYFENSYGDIFRHLGGTRVKFKVIFFLLYAPLYFILRLMGLPGDTFVPSLRLVFRVKK